MRDGGEEVGVEKKIRIRGLAHAQHSHPPTTGALNLSHSPRPTALFNAMRVAAVQDGYTALVLAGRNSHASCFKKLLYAGADFAAFDKVRGTALVLYGFRVMGVGPSQTRRSGSAGRAGQKMRAGREVTIQ